MATFPCSWASGCASDVLKSSSIPRPHNEQRRIVRHYVTIAPSAFSSMKFSPVSSPARLRLPDRSAWPLASTAGSEVQSLGPGDASDVRFATFNVLSSSLCSPQWYCACNPEDLEGDTRLDRVMNQLDAEIAQNAVICLQEVSMAWSGPLYAFFATAGYTFMYSSYGNEDNGFMGVGIAVPLHTYDVLGAEMGRLAGTVQWPRNKGAAPEGTGLEESSSEDTDENSDSSTDETYDEGDEAEPAMAAAGAVSASAATTAQEVAVPEGRRRMSRKEKKLAKKVMEGKVDVGLGQGRRRPHRLSDALDMLNISVSLKRKNCMVSAKLRCKQTGVTFGVSTYHMPCAYKKEDIMLVHAALAFQRAHRLADGVPYVFLGDFNIKPSDAIYSLITNGDACQTSVAPRAISYEGWTSKVPEPMTSAYVDVNSREPDFTNFSILPHQKFVDVLDYVFMSRGCKAIETLDLPDRGEIARALPNKDHPSDHLMIASTVRINNTKEQSSISK